jgi:hypothetical protein
VTNYALRDRIPMWWTHINILTQFTIKKDILHIKLRDGPSLNKSHGKKSVNSSHMCNMSKSLIIISTMLLLKTMSNKTSLISLKRTIRVKSLSRAAQKRELQTIFFQHPPLGAGQLRGLRVPPRLRAE